MTKITSKLTFFSGILNNYAELPKKEIFEQNLHEVNEVKLAYTDKDFPIGNVALSNLTDNPLS